MKTIFGKCLTVLLMALVMNGSAQTVRINVKGDQGYVDVPLVKTNLVNFTNYVFVTITNYVFITNMPARHVIDMPGTVISPSDFRNDLSKTISGPTSFTLGTFALDDDMLLFLSNPGSNTITWPSGLTLPYGPLPTNAGLSQIWFKNVNGHIWASP